MAGVTMTLKRVDQKGHICFEVPEEPMLQEQLRKVLRACRDKNNDYVAVTMARPYSPRTTGPNSQNHMLNGNIVQICNETGNDYDTVKDAVKMIAVEQMDYPFTTIAGHVVPKRERDCNTAECSKLIEASIMLAADLGIVLKQVGGTNA